MTTSSIPPRQPTPPSRRSHQLIAALLLVAIVAFIAASALVGKRIIGGRSGPALARSQVFRWVARGSVSPRSVFDVRFLDPDRANGHFAQELSSLLFDHLVVLDAQLRVEEWGASSIALSPDGTVYTFTLRPGQRFSNGTPVLASDYAYGLDRALNPCVYSFENVFLLALRDAISYSSEPCPDGHTAAPRHTLIGDSILPDDGAGILSLVLARPSASFLDALATGPAVALDPRVVPPTNAGQASDWTNALDSGPTGQGGSGMFYLAHWNGGGPLVTGPGSTLVFKLNPDWWGLHAGKRPHLTEVDVELFVESQRATAAYDSSTGPAQFDYQDAILPDDLAGPSALRDVRHVLSLDVASIVFNWSRSPFGNLDARQTFCLAINRDALVRDIWHGSAIPTWHLVPPGMLGYNPTLTGIDGVTATSGDLSRAHAHWAAYAASLHGRTPPTVTVGINQSTLEEGALDNALIAQWHSAFPTMSSVPYVPPDVLVGNGSVPIGSAYPYDWPADYPDPHDLLWFPFGSQAPYPLSGVESSPPGTGLPAVDALFDRADALYQPADQPLRQMLYGQAEQELIQQVAVCPIAQVDVLYRMRDYVHGCLPDALGVIPTDAWVSCYIAQH